MAPVPFFYKSMFMSALPLLLSFHLYGQKAAGVWDNPKKQGAKMAAKAHDKKNGIKKWKEHLERWGLDSNFNHELDLGVKLHTNGWSGIMSYQTRLSRTTTKLWTLSFSEIIAEKQVKQQRVNTAFPELGKGSPFVFGKINNLYTLQLGYGRTKLLLPGVLEGNASVSVRYQAGPALALLKPYYLNLIYKDLLDLDGKAYTKAQKYEAATADKFLKQDQISGASSWDRGLGDMMYVPGAFCDVALAIEPAKSKVLAETLVVGASVAVYTRKLPVMADLPAYPYQASLYISLMLGKKWK